MATGRDKSKHKVEAELSVGSKLEVEVEPSIVSKGEEKGSLRGPHQLPNFISTS